MYRHSSTYGISGFLNLYNFRVPQLTQFQGSSTYAISGFAISEKSIFEKYTKLKKNSIFKCAEFFPCGNESTVRRR